MTTPSEFDEKINEFRNKIDLQKGTPQKNKALLQYIKEYCASIMTEGGLDSTFERKVKDTLFETEKKLEKMLEITSSKEHQQHQNNMGGSNKYSSGSYEPPRPIHEALNSVQVIGFDPTSSPILRNLHKKRSMSRLSSNKSAEVKQNEYQEIEQQAAPKIDDIKTKIENNATSIDVENQKDISDISILEATPFPSAFPKEDPITEKYAPANLFISQLQIKIPLTFRDSIFQFGQQELLSRELPFQVPDNFFEPILPIQEGNPTEHCVIEQHEKGKFIIKDRFNLQKTYCKGSFINSDGVAIEEGDVIILPVFINNQLSSLTIEFHLGV